MNHDGNRPGAPGPYLMPAGLPPGAEYTHDERPPEGVYYFRIYAGLSAFFQSICLLFGLFMMLSPLFTTARHGRSGPMRSLMGEWIVGLFYCGLGLAFLVPTLLSLFGGRKPWVHTLGTVVIALGMTQICCIPILIPLLIVWMKPETKRWYGAK